MEISAHKFDNKQNFSLFYQDDLVEQIVQRLDLTDEQEGLAVLKAIESQHGLLIERADELWSFSHLTFQEYFTVQWLSQLPPQKLAEKISCNQWQEMVKQLVKSQQPADQLLCFIQKAIDQSIEKKVELQSLLQWIMKQSILFETSCKPAKIRALCFFYIRVFHLGHTLADIDPLDLANAIELNSENNFNSEIDAARAVLSHFLTVARTLIHTDDLTIDLSQLRDTFPSKKLSNNQRNQLQRYYNANQFLVELIKIKGAVSEECRAEIEEGLLLPWAELQRRQPHLYGELDEF